MSKKAIKLISIEDAIRNGNDGQNQTIKGKFVGQHVYCNVNTLAEYVLSKSHEDSDAPFSWDDVENSSAYPEWSVTLLGEDLYFEGGDEAARNEFLEEYDRLIEESDELLQKEEISEATHEHNLELIEEARKDFEALETHPAEIFEWWAVSSYLYDKLKEEGQCVVDAGSCYLWGRCTTGQAILLDGVITRICAEMQILEGQENSWA